MNSLIKKIFLIIAVAVLSIGFTVNAAESVSLDLPEDFYVYSKNPEKVSEILNIEQEKLSTYCTDNNILFLAVNSDNSKQIRVSADINEFSNSVVNISNLSDDKISHLAPDISGIEDVRGEVVHLNGQKFLVVVTKSEDSGGEYILTQYLTVADRQNIALNFYNNASADSEYIDDVFESFTSPHFLNNKNENKINIMLVFVPIAFICFLVACIGLAVSIVLDIKKHKEKYAEEENIDEEENLNDSSENTEEPQ